MKKLFILTLLAAVPAAFAQGGRPDLDSLPGLGEPRAEVRQEAEEPGEMVPRPDADRIMSEISSALRLSSKQEERISSAINKKGAEFDKLMKEYEKSSAEEKKWRYKMNDSRHAMQKLHRELPDTVREYLDDEQRQEFDEMVAARNKPAPKPESPAVEEAKPADDGAAKPVKKKRRLKRKAPNAVRGAAPEAMPGEAAPAADKAAAPAEEEAGQVMVDKEPAAAQPAKKRRLKKKAPPAAAPEAPAEEPAGAKPTGKEAAPEEDAGSYP